MYDPLRGKIGPEVIKLFSCSTQLSMKFIMLINVKIQTIFEILTFMSMINTTSKSLKARNVFFQHFSFYEQLKCHALLLTFFKKFFQVYYQCHFFYFGFYLWVETV